MQLGVVRYYQIESVLVRFSLISRRGPSSSTNDW